MKISTKGRYAMRLMIDLAIYSVEKPVTLKEVSARQDISVKYLEQIVSGLTKAGYVRSIRGAQGGYQLKIPPEECTVGMILRLMEGSLAPVACIEDGECDRKELCVMGQVYRRMNNAINSVVDNITLRDLADWQMEKLGVEKQGIEKQGIENEQV